MSETSVLEGMRAIRAIHPAANVSVELRDAEGYAAVSVIGMPENTFRDDDSDSDDYPNCWFGRGGFLQVIRYADGDMAAALATALELITARSAVSA